MLVLYITKTGFARLFFEPFYGIIAFK